MGRASYLGGDEDILFSAKLQELKTVIQTAVPEIELRGKEFHKSFNELTGSGKYLVKGWDDGEYWSIHDTLKELVTRIRLSDVLLTIERNTIPGQITFRFYYAISLQFEKKGKLMAIYNLLDDNLDHQSKEFINFLHDLLVKK